MGGEGGGGGEAFSPKHPASPPKRKRERRKEEKERERKKEREVHGVGRGARTFLRRIASDQYIVSYFMTQLFKSTR